jgi:ribonuclease HII
VLRALGDDPRAGARQLALLLERRRARDSAERRRQRVLFRVECRARASGAACIAGIDESGMGPLAGPVVAAAVVLPPRVWLEGLDDSKRLTAGQRQRLHDEIHAVAIALGVGWATPSEVDALNVYQAGLTAMRRALDDLDVQPDLVLIDARRLPDLSIPQRAITRGDQHIGSIAAASVVAKVYRDAWMSDLERRHPGYGFSRNAGYGTAEHLRALRERGPTPVHRFSFEPVRLAAARVRAASAGAGAGA